MRRARNWNLALRQHAARLDPINQEPLLYEAVADFGFRDTTLHLLDEMARSSATLTKYSAIVPR